MKVKLLKQFMSASMGTVLEVKIDMARYLIGNGIAEQLDQQKSMSDRPPANKSVSEASQTKRKRGRPRKVAV